MVRWGKFSPLDDLALATREAARAMKSQQLFEAAQQHLIGGAGAGGRYHPLLKRPLYLARGKGSRFWDVDGKEYMVPHEEEALEGGQVALPEVADRPEVGSVVPREHSEGDVLLIALGDLPGGGNPEGIGVEEELYHHPGVVRRIASGLLFIDGDDGGEIELVREIREKVDEVILGQPVPQRRREQEELLWIVGTIGLIHAASRVRAPHGI